MKVNFEVSQPFPDINPAQAWEVMNRTDLDDFKESIASINYTDLDEKGEIQAGSNMIFRVSDDAISKDVPRLMRPAIRRLIRPVSFTVDTFNPPKATRNKWRSGERTDISHEPLMKGSFSSVFEAGTTGSIVTSYVDMDMMTFGKIDPMERMQSYITARMAHAALLLSDEQQAS